jgi:hypothetical protein
VVRLGVAVEGGQEAGGLLAAEGDDGDDELGDADQQGDCCHGATVPSPVA